MSLESILKAAKQSIIDIDEEQAVSVAKKALEEGLNPVQVLTEGYSAGIREIGELFSRGEVFLPEMILSAEAMKAATAVLESAITGAAAEKRCSRYRQKHCHCPDSNSRGGSYRSGA